MIERNDIILYYPASALGKVISYFSGRYSHVAIAVNEKIEISASFSSGGIETEQIKQDRQKDVYRLKPEIIFDEKEAWTWAMDVMGEKPKYDKLGLIAFLLRKPFLNNPSKYFCSEFVNEFFSRGNVILRPDLRSWEISPTDIANSNLLENVPGPRW